MDKRNILALKNELNRQEEEVTNRLLKEPDLQKRLLLNERREGIRRIIQICKDRNRF